MTGTPLPPPRPAGPVGERIRAWRLHRRRSQLDLSLDIGISQKHLSFLESGRAIPSREMVLRIAAGLDVPLRERNLMLQAAGHAAVFRQRPLDDPALAAARAAIDLILRGHEPFPALAVDRHWRLVAANAALAPLLALVADRTLLLPPVNVLRLSLDPGGLAPHILNRAEWRSHLLDRLRRQAETTNDPELARLHDELAALPAGEEGADAGAAHADYGGVLVPLRLRVGPQVLSFLSTTTVFGTPTDITLSELVIEAFLPADPQTTAALRG
ncbi:helix-turn-helix domain-containing protein [Azospirillum picis]|uniref:Transcriptional regulator with XRE-family HTH domain n=1 Tax=Azospirillum picis TaxID=488438 RepID=A0ABU0MRR7_9PROT|nr:helix-turn-helix transcriptional regulator [Azospirillum picis]MBP2302237.1 transcriptional regulator with XRE-family HTH domain [Azospirillum picis]MDQ0535816.1 transcriptional regulator with XRE-family HTH domain [Azospirillum picis]